MSVNTATLRNPKENDMPEIPSNYRRLEKTERRPLPTAKLLFPTDEAEIIRVTIVLRRRTDGPPVPDHSHYLTTPPSLRRRLSSDEFEKKYGADQADIDQVSDFLTEHDLTVDQVHVGRRTILASGTVAQFSEAFAVTLNQYEHEVARGRGVRPQIETYRDYEGFIYAPDNLAEIIIGIFGFDNRRITKRNAGDPPGTTTIPVNEVTKLYDFPGNLAAGQTIAIFSEGGYLPSDISSNFGGSPPVVIDVPVDASNGGFPDPETTQDIFIAGSAAPGAEIAVYFTTYTQKGWVDLITRVVHPDAGDPVCSVLSSSFYVSNGDDAPTLLAEGISSAWITAVTQAFEDAAIQAVTICIASGDTGTDSKVGDGLAHVQYPASDPWVLSVGGTTVGDISGSSFDEYSWTDTFTFGGFTGSGATGGGISDFFPMPSYQVDAGVPVSLNDGHRGRGLPDVAANASPNSGYPIILGGAPSIFPASGTSASAPLWAGLIAVINAALAENVGFVNPVLYALGSSVFRDIVAEPGATNNGMNGVPGYPVGPGWDACTGWGSPKGNALLNGLKHFYGPAIAVNAQDDLLFGTVCKGPKFLNLRIFNVGTRNLMVLSVQRFSGSADFSVLAAPAVPLSIAPGALVDFTIEYNPTTRGVTESATIRITSNDPVTPTLDLIAKGFGGTGSLATVIADKGDFGDSCVGSFVDQELTLNNNGSCRLSIFDVVSSSPEFTTPSVNTFPLVVAPGASIAIPLRFQPGSFGAKTATISISSDDPAGVRTINVSGNAPAGKLAVGGSTYFGEVDCGVAYRTVSICNVGKCDLHVSSVAFRRERRNFKLISNPFPGTLPRGCCLKVVIQYQACCEPECCELVITSDDPAEPVKTLDVIAYTRCYKPCKKEREEEKPCKKRHSEKECDCVREEDECCHGC
jgi:kumamolisin